MGCCSGETKPKPDNGEIVSKRAIREKTQIVVSEKNTYQQQEKVLFPPLPLITYQNQSFYSLYGTQVEFFQSELIDVKKPVGNYINFAWIEEPRIQFPKKIKQLKAQEIKSRTFQQKMTWFRLKIEDLRIPWQKGSEKIAMARSDLIMSSVVTCMRIKDWHREVKIKFKGEEVEDVGGVIREWMHLVLADLFGPQRAILKQCQTKQTAYKIIWDHMMDEEHTRSMFWLMGVIIGKALFERIPINCPLNKSLLRQICNQKVTLPDMFSFDQQLYKAWRTILQEDNTEDLYLTFEERKEHQDGKMESIKLKNNGENITVTNSNKREYIISLIDLYSYKSIEPYVKFLKKGVYLTIPPQLLSVFEPHELENLMCGPDEINVQDWRQNTAYRGYSQNDTIILWFWQVVSNFDQTKLKNLLHFCTGSNRVPVLGFKYLESNRGHISKFNIEKIPYEMSNPYPKSYTCFNRLQLPNYSSKAELNKNIDFIVREEINHFGLQ